MHRPSAELSLALTVALAIVSTLAPACRPAEEAERDGASGSASPQPAAAPSEAQAPESLQEETVSEKPLVALVWMRSTDGPDGATADRPANPTQIAAATAHFRELGFEVAAPQGGQFSIVGPKRLFESAFGTELEVETDTAVVRRVGDGEGLELDLAAQPDAIRESIHVVTFEEPLEFGPGDF